MPKIQKQKSKIICDSYDVYLQTKFKFKMYNQNYSERAIPLVAVNENTGKYEMTQESVNFLRSVPAPLGIVSVAGLYRTGKSYLLNRMLLNTNKPKQGFGVGPTINPCTKGLWCWGTPIKGKSQNGESINIIVIDTEGIGALDQDQTHDTRIFTLAILASSCFIYNSVGSIDQTAVQNLSLVVNLTKHIQLKSTNKSYDEEEDADQMAHYFPTFYWVVRDFSLQLQDPQGNAITSKDYLEKALSPLKGVNQFDEDIEQKNRIRKLLTSFFRDRDCFTMVRPLVDETKLQDLDSIPFEELRPDFIEQVIQFRKRVTQGLKIKTLNGKALNGDMYCNMLSSYVGAINDGAVPNIQNAWNYMCQEQCQKVQDQCENIFDKELKDNMKFPVQEEYFDNTCENALETCLLYYRQKAIGDMNLSMKYQKELKQRIKEKVKLAREQNIKASKEFLQKKVLQVFNPIIEQLKKQHFKTFEEFEKTISSSYENLIANSPNLPYTKQKYLELYKKVQRQGADYIFKCLNKEIQNMKAIFKEKEDFYVKQVESLKNDQESDRKNYSQKITEMDRDKIQTQNKIQRLEFELDKLIKEKESQTDKLSKNLSSKQNEFENSRKELENKLQDLEQKYEQVSRTFTKEQKIWEKDKAIMENKVKQQNTTIQELEKQRQLMTAKFEEMTQETTMNYKQNANKAEKKMAQLENEIKKLKQTKFQLTENLKSTKDQLQERNQRYDRTEKKLKEELNSKKRQLENYKNQFELEKKKFQQQLQEQRQKITKTKSTLSEDYKKQKDTITQIAEELRKTKADSETKKAELQQRIKFSEDEKKFLKEQLEENKRLHQRAIEDLKMQNDQEVEEREKVRIEEVRTELTTEIKNVTITYENERKKITYEVENLRNTNKDLELQLKVAKQQCQDEKNNYKQLEEETSKKIESLEQQLRNLQRSKESTLMERQNLLKKKIIDLERQIESIKEKYQTEQRDTEQKNKQCIIQLRVTYERQRDDMQNNYLREKERAQRKYDEMVQEYESKHRQQIQNMEEELEMVKQDAAFMEEDLRNTINQLKYMVDSRDKDIQNLKNLLQELKATLGKKEEEFSRKIEHMTTSYKQQKENLNMKLQTLQQQNNQLQKDLMNLNHEKQRLTNELEKTKNILSQIQTEYSLKKEEYLLSTQNWKRKYAEKENQLMEFKINYEKQTALLSQENQHISEKNNQLQQELNRINEVNEEKIKKIKVEAQETIATTIEKYSSERNHIQQKYDKNKKVLKETESALNKKLNEMQKERAVDFEKISNLQMKLAALEERKKMEVSTLQKELEKLKETYRQEKNQLSSELNRLKDEIQQISRKKLDIETRYDKDILLLRNEVQNQINIRETREASYNENIRQLEARIENLQRTKSSEQSKAQSTYNEQRVRIEQTYRTKVTECNKMIEKLTRDYDDLSKRYEYDLKDLKEMLAVQKQTKESLQTKLDKKSNQWQELQRKLNHDIDTLKSERQQRGLEFQRELEKEKQSLKLKLNDLENKLRATQKERTTQFMDYEKEKARFSQQQSSIAQEMQHLKDKIAKLQKDKTRLDKQNERLKIEKRNNKNASYIRFNTGLEERKSQITINTIRKEKMVEKKDSQTKSQLSYNEDLLSSTNKENMVSQNNMLLE